MSFIHPELVMTTKSESIEETSENEVITYITVLLLISFS